MAEQKMLTTWDGFTIHAEKADKDSNGESLTLGFDDEGKIVTIGEKEIAGTGGSGLPVSETANSVLFTEQAEGTPEWAEFTSKPFGNQLLDDEGNPVLDEEESPIYDDENTVELWASFNDKEFGAKRAYEDHLGNNIAETYATKDIIDGLETALDTLNDTIETVSHAGMYDLGTKTESDLNSGKLAIGCGNSTTELTLTTVNSLTVLSNSGVANFALLVDNSGNSNDVTVTVKDSTDETTFYQSTAAGNKVSAGKIVQITCVGKCWTLAEFEAPA